ncbi:hypothetical protein [Caballeronia sp. LjRoot31]|uniref:hypothetical protein n=1 Tax=Caballeronia sp. LjRoot31 TaxID=3342324 RepID=UPI003ECF4D5D
MDLNEIGSKSAGIWGWIGGGGLGVLGITALQLRKWLSRDGVDRRRDSAEKDLINTLSEQLDKANARAALAEKRADDAYKERNDTIREIGVVSRAMAAMEERMKQQAALIEQQNTELGSLRCEVQSLREKLNETH